MIETGSDPLSILLLLALLSPRSNFLSLIPPGQTREDITLIVEEARKEAGPEVEKELEVLERQVGALGECCKSEEEGHACACGKVDIS